MALLDDFVIVVGQAAENHGLVTRQQLLAAGVPAVAITRLAQKDRAMVSLGQGVYLVPALQDAEMGAHRVALQRLDPSRDQGEYQLDPLHADGGVLSHLSAAHVWGAVDLPREEHITTPRQRRLQGITTHTAALDPSQVTIRHGLPVTTLEQTTRDLAAWPMDDEHRSRWVDHCRVEGLLSDQEITELLGDAASRTLCWLD